MKVILTMDVPDIGSRGDRVEVAAGYARNYLIPRQLAVPETRGNLRMMEEEGKLAGVRDKKARQDAQRVGDLLEQTELFATLKIGREGKAFGAITSKDITILLRQNNLEVDRRRIQLDSPIKRLGVFEIPLNVHSDVKTMIKLFVDREGGSPEGATAAQAEYDERVRIADEAARAEAEARAQREREAEEAARIAIEKAAARKAREEEAAKAKAEAEAKSAAIDGDGDAKPKDAGSKDEPKAEAAPPANAEAS